MQLSRLALPCLLALLTGCASIELRDADDASIEATAKSVAAAHGAKGIVLLDVNWGRRWNCGGFENAELRIIGFDRLPETKTEDDRADVMLIQPPLHSMASRPVFDSYALLLEPGEYTLAGFLIHVAYPSSDDYWAAKRSDMLKDGKMDGGTFKVAAGEIVYIGNFFLDCFKAPQLWRYYTEGGENFKAHLAQYKQKYPFIDTGRVTYRLFETSRFGRPYELK
jgi:hypothetical protein